MKITDDPEAYVREELKKMNEEYRVSRIEFNMTADFNEKVKHTDKESSASTWVNVGYFILRDLMKGLNLKAFFRQKTGDRRITYDCFTISRFLTYARILDPAFKHAARNRLASYYEQPDFDCQHILRFMDLLERNYDDYLAWLYKNSNSVIERDTSVLYHDCANFYFECEQPDEDAIDEVIGETISGLRKYGIRKEHRPDPIVEIGLFMDSRGIPITMCLHPGNASGQTTAIPLEKEVLKMPDGARFIYCADAGLGSGTPAMLYSIS